MAVDWSSLPADLIGAIAIKSETIEDFIYFSAVCRSWNYASSSIKHLWKCDNPFPWLLLAENDEEYPDNVRKVFNPDNGKCYKLQLPEAFGARCWGSPYGYVVMVTRDFNVQLFNPITKSKLHFPSCETLKNPLVSLLSFNGPGVDEDYYYRWFLWVNLVKIIVIKVTHDDHYEFIIMVLYDAASKLAYARYGDQSWTPILIEASLLIPMDDLMIMDNNVYGVYDDGTMVYWKVNELFGSEPIKPVSFTRCQCENYTPSKWLEETYLVQSGNDILMVVRHKKEVSNSDDVLYETFIYETYSFEVYKLNPKDKSWVYTEDVGNVALFVGCNHSMSVSIASATKHLQTNCIYFTDDEKKSCKYNLKEHRGNDMGVFDIKTQKISRFYEGDDTCSVFCAPIWFIPNL